MKAVYKYPLAVTDVQEIGLPKGAQILSVQFQRIQLCLWALVDVGLAKKDFGKDDGYEIRRIRILGTGHQVRRNPGTYLGTVQEHGGSLVWHIFEEK